MYFEGITKSLSYLVMLPIITLSNVASLKLSECPVLWLVIHTAKGAYSCFIASFKQHDVYLFALCYLSAGK